MIEIRSIGEDSTVQVRVKGVLEAEDFEAANALLAERSATAGPLRVLLEVEEFDGWEDLAAMWGHFSLVRDRHRDVERIAIVGDKTWKQALAAFARPFLDAEERYFDGSELSEAKSWLRGGDEEE